ncbi:MAG: acyltransferase [Opitutus sp.]|nr:acyltransferase [Opitutus sp.]
MIQLPQVEPYSDSNGNVIVGMPKWQTNVKVVFGATNCRIEIAEGVRLENLTINMTGPGGLLKIGRSSCVRSGVRVGLNSSIIIGERLSSTSGGSFSAAEGTSVTIGDDCMFAVSIDIRSDHSHPIFDRATGARTNVSKSVAIGNHVWLGPQAFVYPGSVIGDGAVIGARSIVFGTIPAHCVAVGTPARVVRENIVWDKTHVAITAPWQFDHLSDIKSPWLANEYVS